MEDSKRVVFLMMKVRPSSDLLFVLYIVERGMDGGGGGGLVNECKLYLCQTILELTIHKF